MENIFGEVPTGDEIFLPSEPFEVRNNGKLGQLTQGDILLGNKAEIFICHFRQFFGDLGQTENEKWNEIYFYPLSENLAPVVSRMFFKKKARGLFNDMINCLLSKKIPPQIGKFSMAFKEKSFSKDDGSLVSYFHLTWDWQPLEKLPEEQQLIWERLSATVQGHVFPLPTVGNLIALPADGSKHDAAIASFKAAKNQQQLPQNNQQQLTSANPF